MPRRLMKNIMFKRVLTGVPTNVFFLVMVAVSYWYEEGQCQKYVSLRIIADDGPHFLQRYPTCPDTPKSANLTSPSVVKRTLAAR